MEISNFERSQVLVQALPYIQKYYQKTIVIKYGGNAMINEGLKDAVMTDIVLLSLVGSMWCSFMAAARRLTLCSTGWARKAALWEGCAIRIGNHGRGADGARGQGQ